MKLVLTHDFADDMVVQLRDQLFEAEQTSAAVDEVVAIAAGSDAGAGGMFK